MQQAEFDQSGATCFLAAMPFVPHCGLIGRVHRLHPAKTHRVLRCDAGHLAKRRIGISGVTLRVGVKDALCQNFAQAAQGCRKLGQRVGRWLESCLSLGLDLKVAGGDIQALIDALEFGMGLLQLLVASLQFFDLGPQLRLHGAGQLSRSRVG